MKKISTLCICFFLLATATVFSQNSKIENRRVGEVLVQLENGFPLPVFLENLNQKSASQFSLIESPAADWNIHLLGFDEKNGSQDYWLHLLRSMTGVVEAGFNFKTDERDTEPNDSEWWRQWDMDLIGAPGAWDNATGGLTAAGDTIVIAVLEKGADMSHSELAPNKWFNWKEIPNNNLDDDSNGYTDDHAGWNPRSKDDDPGATSSHGTGVNGIIGARGDNSAGIAGVNWTVKLMNLSNVEYESEIIAAYNYVARQRRDYNSSGGSKGAFVVATNASFGIDNEFAQDHKIWCAVYDSLGKYGIVSVGATANKNVDVETEGDMPTTCASEFLITVTNVDKTDKKVVGAGYGSVSLDLGAPGQDTYTTTLNNGFATLGGTSAATPHVTGAIGVLYSLKCASIAADALTSPVACARRFRQLVLSNVQKIASLDGVSTTGGRLDLSAAVDSAVSSCGGSSGPMAIKSVRPNFGHATQVRVFYETPDYSTYTFRVFNMLGQLMHEEKVVPEAFGAKVWTFDPTTWAAGYYMVTFNRGRKFEVAKFLKI